MHKLIFLVTGAVVFAQAPKAFDTPEAAAEDLIQAAASNNTGELSTLFGAQGKTVLTSGDPRQDKAEQQEFASIAKNKHRLEKDSMDSNRMILSVGSEDWPFPVPIVQKNGKWMFDTTMGELAMKARRIGANELDAIEVCAGYVGAQLAYAEQSQTHDYARHIADLGGHVPKEFIDATGPNLKPYHGYYFRSLTAQGSNAPGAAHSYVVKDTMIGGFALEAWPAKYGVTGVHAFIVNQDGVVYEKDLGAASSSTTPPIATYNPDKTWIPVN